MTKRMSDEERFEANDRRRCRADEKASARLDRMLDARDRAIAQATSHPRMGQLCREGKTVYYVVISPVKVRESADPLRLAKYLD